MGFFSSLEKRASEVESLLCIGLDPHVGDLPKPDYAVALEYCLQLVDVTADFVLAYKPNIAFFEVFGAEGIAALKELISQIPDEIPVILDAKRGDIASSAQAYSEAIFTSLGADAVTINPYLGSDAIEPFVNNEQNGVFLLCKTSNPSAAELQDLLIAPSEVGVPSEPALKVYELIASRAKDWNVSDNIGLVVGATQPEALKRVRELAPELWLLAPGVGAQGGDIEAALQAGLRPDGYGMLIPISRGISRRLDPRGAAKEFNTRINLVRKKIRRTMEVRSRPIGQVNDPLENLAVELLESGFIKFGRFKLKSGLVSPIYIDLRRLVGMPDSLNKVAASYLPVLRNLTFDRLAALPYAGLPIATAISLKAGYPLIYPRKETKTYGTKAEIEGIYTSGEKVVLIDDLATTGGSKFEAIEKLDSVSLKVRDVVVLIDRQSGALEDLADAGYDLHAIFQLTNLLDYWESAGLIDGRQVSLVQEFIASTQMNRRA